MKCPSESTLLRATLGELSVNEARELATHRDECVHCRRYSEEQEQVLADLRTPPSLGEADAAQFTARVMAACRAEPGAALRVAPTARDRVRSLVAIGFAAVAALSLAMPQEARDPGPQQTWASRGSSAPERADASADVLYLRAGVLHPLRDAELTRGDAFVVRCTNRRATPSYLAVFALDARGDAHWIYPAYVDPLSNPESVPIAAQARDLVLDEVVEPDAPANGDLRIFALSSTQPLRVQDIERQLDAFRGDRPRPPFADVHVQQWRARWNER
jgi:hypothetical protein